MPTETAKKKQGVAPPPPRNDDPLLDCAAAADYLGLTGHFKRPDRVVGTLCRNGELPYVEIGRKYMIRRSHLDKWIERQEATAGSGPAVGKRQ